MSRENKTISVYFYFCTKFLKVISTFIELSHDIFTFSTDNVLFFNVTKLSQYIFIL
jgi:hypothetical protein